MTFWTIFNRDLQRCAINVYKAQKQKIRSGGSQQRAAGLFIEKELMQKDFQKNRASPSAD